MQIFNYLLALGVMEGEETTIVYAIFLIQAGSRIVSFLLKGAKRCVLETFQHGARYSISHELSFCHRYQPEQHRRVETELLECVRIAKQIRHSSNSHQEKLTSGKTMFVWGMHQINGQNK